MKKSALLKQVEKMSDAELAKLITKRVPVWRRTISKLSSLLRAFGSKIKGKFLGTAADAIVKVSAGGGAVADTDTLTVEKFDAPGPRVLQKYIDALDGIGDIDALDEMISRAERSENAALKKAAVGLDKIRDALIDAYTEALQKMSDVADNHLPASIGAIFKAGEKYFEAEQKKYIDSLPEDDRAEATEMFYYINVGVKDGVIDFIWNADITHLPHQSGSERLCVVVTARLTPTDDAFSTRVFVNAVPKVALPGLYNIGTEVPGASASVIAKALPKQFKRELSLHGVSAFMAPAELNIDETEVNTRLMRIEGVTGVAVDTNAITIEFPSGDRGIQAQVLRTLDQIPEIKKLFKQGYEKSLQEVDDNTFTYTLSLKH